MSPGSTTLHAVSVVGPADRLSTMPSWPWGPFDPNAPPTLGWLVARWAETLLVQPNGPRAKLPFRFTADQLRFLLWWYALDEHARWIFQYAARRLAKGSGKSPFAAVLCLIEFCGPVRLERFDDREAGGVRGRPVDLPLVQIAATAESQTANTMRMVRAFAPKGSPIVREYDLDPGKTLYYKQPEGTLEVITSSVTAAEGAETSFLVADETEHWKPSNAGPELAATLEDNLSKSSSRMLETANAWVPGVDCVAEDTWDAWVLQEEGRTRDESKRILYDARLAPADTDLADYESLHAALQWVYGDCDWKRLTDGSIDVSSIIGRIWSPKAKPSESKRKYLNWPSAAEDAWIIPEQFKALAQPEITVSPRDEVVMFFDGSKGRDATALIGCRVDDGHVFTIGIWEPDPNNADDIVDPSDVDRIVTKAREDLNVVAFFGDVREFESYVYTVWPALFGDDLVVHAVPTGRPPHAIAWDMRGHTYEFAKACEAVEAEIVEGAFTHDGNPRLTAHVVNARRRPYRDAIGIGKESKDSPRKIDAAVCMVGARMVRRIVLASGRRGRRKNTVYVG